MINDFKLSENCFIKCADQSIWATEIHENLKLASLPILFFVVVVTLIYF